MTDILLIKSEQESVNKAAIIAVFLFAGVLFLWQFIEDRGSKKNLNSLTETPQIDNISKKRWPTTFSNQASISKRINKSERVNPKSKAAIKVKPSEKLASLNISQTKKISKQDLALIPTSKEPAINNLNQAFVEISNVYDPVEYENLLLNDKNNPETISDPNDYKKLLLNDRETTPETNIENGDGQLYDNNAEQKDYSIQVSLPISSRQANKPLDQIETSKTQQPQTSISDFDIKPTKALSTQHKNSFSTQIEKPIKQSVLVATKTANLEKSKVKSVHIVRTDKPNTKKLKQYRIKNGDTLYSLSRRFNVSLNNLLQSNTISKKSKLKIGQIIIIPHNT